MALGSEKERLPRSSDGHAQRLRFGFGEEGLEFYANRPSEPVLTEDHLAAALSLLDNCNLIVFDRESGRYTLPRAESLGAVER